MNSEKIDKLLILFLAIIAVLILTVLGIGFHLLISKNADEDKIIKLIGIGVGIVSAILVAIVATLNVNRQKKANKELEEHKKRIEAYKALNNLATQFYFSLHTLASGEWDYQRIKDSKKEMENAAAHLPFILREHRELWWEYFQVGNFIKETVEQQQLENDREGQIKFWKNESEEFSLLFSKFQDATGAVFNMQDGVMENKESI